MFLIPSFISIEANIIVNSPLCLEPSAKSWEGVVERFVDLPLGTPLKLSPQAKEYHREMFIICFFVFFACLLFLSCLAWLDGG